MGTIRILPDHVVNRIAAGEVIERPASVVKELMENSIDAGATRITVEVGYGGKGFIRVRDNGCGMDRDDAVTCLVRHATSKIASAEDIQHIRSLGFRGEALPSIAAVSRLRLTTRVAGAQTATLVTATGGAVESVTETVAEPGTTVEASDLFFNTPARKKFLKSDTAEYNAIAEVFDTLALSRSDIAFTLSRNNAQVAAYPATAAVLERIAQVMGSEITERMHLVTIRESGFSLYGYIGSPELSRINRTGQKFFINTRPVQSVGLSMALSRAYEEFLERGRFPVAVLFLEIDEQEVDVNVHPAKREVRLRNERSLMDCIARAIRQELGAGAHVPLPSVAYSSTAQPARFDDSLSASLPSLQVLRESCTTWQRSSQPLIPDHPSGGDILVSQEPLVQAPCEQQQHHPFSRCTVLGQVMHSYIVAADEEGIVVFDQHAAHERILYEALLAAMLRQQPASQTVIFPVTLHLSLQEAQVMEACQKDFQAMGFGIRSLGGRSFAVDALPACIAGVDTAALLRDCLHELAEDGPARSVTKRQEALAALVACKTRAIKAVKPLSGNEMHHLIEQLGNQGNPHVCPHGRPTYFKITRKEIERRLKRT